MRFFFAGLVLITGIQSWAQCPVADFSIPSTGCIGQNLEIQNNSSGAVSYEWDFCTGDLLLTPNSNIAVNNSLLFRTRSIRVVRNLGNWFGFTIDQANSPYRLIRFNFGTSLLNNPSITDLGNPSNLLNGAYDFQMYNEEGNWYALVVNTGANAILKYTFGTSLDSPPTVENLGSFALLNTPNGISIINNNGQLSAFVTNGGISQIIRLDFGVSINNIPTATAFSVPGGSALRGISITRECDRWFGLVTSYGNAKVFWLDFDNGLDQSPQIGEITFFTSYNFPASISIISDGGEYYSFIQSAVGPLYRLAFGASIIDKAGTGQNLGNFGVTENFATDWVKDNSDWYGFSIDLTNRRLIRYLFPTVCDAIQPVYSGATPPLINYSESGNKVISLVTKNSSGGLWATTKAVMIAPSIAPNISFTSQNICVNHDVNFTSQNSSGDIVQYDWDFGDTNSSGEENPVHQYASNGEYNVELVVTAQNGCKNLARQSLTMFNEPIPDFSIPLENPICTNQNFLFENISSVDAGYAPEWEWEINGVSVSTNEDLSYTFTNTVDQEIKLIASIPGCESEIIKNINTLVEGPQPDFTFAGQCEEVDITFTNHSTDTINGYSWDFDDGQNSIVADPAHAFSEPGEYDVTLTASNAAGCNNTISKPVTIYSKPQVNFTALLPPFSCNGTPTQFNDLTPNPTDSNLASWLWDFGDTGSGENTALIKNPQHTYDVADVYDVTLMVTTNFLCESTLQLPVTISQSPIADFNFTPTCEDVPVNFTDVSTGTIQSWSWQIGSSFYSTQNPTHAFSNPVSTNAMLTVTAGNNCISSTTKPIVVPAKLNPDFSVLRNCIDQQAVFTDITNDGADPVLEYDWDFAGLGNAIVSPAQFTFSTIGNKNVMLAVTTETGCEYSVTKSINVINPPLANFTALPNSGSQPLEVQFTNTSVEAVSYVWDFNDSENSTSFEVSPVFVFEEPGEYEVSLIAYNSVNCSDTTAQQIVVSPITSLDEEGNFYFKAPYPNPAHGNLFLEWTARQSENLSIKILDAFGRVVQMANFQSIEGINEASLSLFDLNPGIYFIQMRLGQMERTFRVMMN